MKSVSARVANQAFSRLLAAAAAGEEIVIMRRGKAVARLGPVAADEADATRQRAVRRMIRRMRRGFRLGGVKIPREAIYER